MILLHWKKKKKNWYLTYKNFNHSITLIVGYNMHIILKTVLLTLIFFTPFFSGHLKSSQTFFLTSLYHHTLNTHPHSHLHPIIGKNQHISSHNFLNLQPWQENISYHLIFVLNFPTCLGCLEGWREKKMLHSSFALRCLKSHHQPIIFTLLHF